MMHFTKGDVMIEKLRKHTQLFMDGEEIYLNNASYTETGRVDNVLLKAGRMPQDLMDVFEILRRTA